MQFRMVLVLGFLTLLSACSTYSKKQCESMNWKAEGYKSALRGETAQEGYDYFVGTCGKDHGIKPTAEEFKLGYKDGLAAFCTPEAMLQFAQRGGVYRNICPAVAQEELTKNYQSGRLKFLENKVSELESEVSRLKGKLSDAENTIDALRSELSRKR